jgi:hypothetical protein
MLAEAWRSLTIMLAALSMGMAFCHLLEMPAKLTYSAGLWLTLLQTLYPAFGTVGAIIEVGAVVTAITLVFLVRERRAFRWTLLAALCLASAHAAWWLWVAPVNVTLVPLTSDTLPARGAADHRARRSRQSHSPSRVMTSASASSQSSNSWPGAKPRLRARW